MSEPLPNEYLRRIRWRVWGLKKQKTISNELTLANYFRGSDREYVTE